MLMALVMAFFNVYGGGRFGRIKLAGKQSGRLELAVLRFCSE